jgi:hypothetical protein
MDPIPGIAHNFENFRTVELGPTMSDELVNFARNAFWQGAGSTLWMVERITQANTPAEGIAALAALREEYCAHEMERITTELEAMLGRALDGIAVVHVKLRG